VANATNAQAVTPTIAATTLTWLAVTRVRASTTVRLIEIRRVKGIS
jgi:hypothetical protein